MPQRWDHELWNSIPSLRQPSSGDDVRDVVLLSDRTVVSSLNFNEMDDNEASIGASRTITYFQLDSILSLHKTWHVRLPKVCSITHKIGKERSGSPALVSIPNRPDN